MIYLIHAVGTDRYKIGYTQYTAVDRIKSGLQTGCPYPLAIISIRDGDQTDENELHVYFHDFHKIGEWFAFNDIQAIKSTFDRFVFSQSDESRAKAARWKTALKTMNQRIRDTRYRKDHYAVLPE